MRTKEIGGGWKLIGTEKSRCWSRLVDPNGRQYRPEEVDDEVLREVGYGAFPMSKEAAKAFTDWGAGKFGAVALSGGEARCWP